MDHLKLATEIVEGATRRGLWLSTAESCTGGLVAATLTEVAGTSSVFGRGFITYSNAAKQDLLQVSAESLRQFGAVSEPVAREMAEGALNASGADIAVSVTGVAGPGASGPKPEGRVCFGLARRGKSTDVDTVEFGALGRSVVRRAAVGHALMLCARALRDIS